MLRVGFLIHIGYGEFLVGKLTFLETFYLLCNLISYRGEHYSVLSQSKCYSLVKILVTLCYLCFLDKLFLQWYHCSFKMIQGCKTFRLLCFGLVRACRELVCLFSCPNLFSYLTRNSEYCVRKSGLEYLQATSVSV